MLLGRGGMVEVWRAAGLGSDEDFTRRFRRECALTAKLTGPHVIPIHGYGEIDGRFYIYIPLIEGVDVALQP